MPDKKCRRFFIPDAADYQRPVIFFTLLQLRIRIKKI